MKLVIDANELFSIIIAKGKDRETKKIDILFSDKFELFAPSLLFTELHNNKEEIKEKSGFSENNFLAFLKIIELRIKTISEEDLSEKLEEAKSISTHPKDILYFAVALKLDCPIWSGEKRLKNQQKVKVYNTKDIIEKFEI